jgi:hypothetical protein
MGVVVSTLPSAAGFVLSGALLPPHSHPVVLEAAYVPGGTALAKQIAQLNLNQHSGGAGAVAATAGPLQMIVGLEMLFEQAAGQFEHWARVPFQRKVGQRMGALVGAVHSRSRLMTSLFCCRRLRQLCSRTSTGSQSKLRICARRPAWRDRTGLKRNTLSSLSPCSA